MNDAYGLRISHEPCGERRKVNVVYMPYCMGGTYPMSLAGTLTQCNAEIPTGIVLTQLGSEGAPFIYGAMQSIMDMKMTVGSYGAVLLHSLITAASEIADYYDLPSYVTAGCTDAKMLDALRFLEIWRTENRDLTI